MDEHEDLFPTTQINAKILTTEKVALLKLATAKGTGGLTGLLKLLAKAKEVQITL